MDDKKISQKDFQQIERLIGDQEIDRWEKKAQEYIIDPTKTNNLLNEAYKKANNQKHIDPINKIWEKIQLLLSLVKDWMNGEYRQVAKSSLLLIIGGLIYFVSPIDIVPDWVLGLGLIDDATMLALIINRLDKEISLYKEWKSR